MTPTLTQLGALIPLDPTTLVCLSFALLPGAWTLRALRPALARPLWLRVPLYISALLSLALPVLPWPIIALLNVLLFTDVFAFATSEATPRRRWSALFLLSAFWSLQTFRTFWQTFFEPDGRAHFWFVDFFNKLYLLLILPLLEAVGASEASASVLRYLNEPLAFFSNHLLAMHLMASMGAVLLLTQVLIGRLDGAEERERQVGVLWQATLPPSLALLALATMTLQHLVSGIDLLHVGRELAGALLVAQGALCAWTLSLRHDWSRTLLFAFTLAACLHPTLFGCLILLGALDSFFGIRIRRTKSPALAAELAERSARIVRILRRSFGPALIVLALIPLLTFPFVPLSHGVTKATREPSTTKAQKAVKSEGPRVSIASKRLPPFTIDRYEHPNVLGEMPTRGQTPQQAAALCAAQNQHLCGSVAWYEACSNQGERFYLVPSYPYQASALSRLRRECNLRGSEGAARMLPSGAMARCKGAYGVHDLTGNAYEWVQVPELDGFWGLAGSYYAYSDAQTPSCGFRVLVHEAQLGIIDLDATGFRCCSGRMDNE